LGAPQLDMTSSNAQLGTQLEPEGLRGSHLAGGRRFEERQTSAGTDENYGENVGYFTYEYDPQAKPSRLDVRALDFSERLTFKGARLPPEVLSGCVASVWRKGGPVHGIVFLASLVLALRFRRRH